MAFNILGGIDFVQQQGEQGRQRYADRLLGQAYAAPPEQRQSALAKLAGTDGRLAMDAGAAFQAQDDNAADRRNKLLTSRAGVMVAMPAEQRALMWPSVRADLVRNDPELAALPEQYDDAQFGPVIQQLALGGRDQKSDLPSSVREAMAFRADPSLLETRKAMYDTYSWGETKDAQGRDVWVPRSNRTAAIGAPGGGTVSVGEPQQIAGNAGAGLMGLVGNGVVMTSGYRDPANNGRVDGASNSQHMQGTAGDFVVPQAQKAAFMQRAREAGYEAIDEGDHIHVELPPQGARPASGGGGMGQTDADRANAAAQKVRAEETARRQLGLEYAGPEAEAAARREAMVTDARETAQASAQRRALLPQVITKADQTVALIEKALSHPGRTTATGLSGSIDPRNYAPGTDATDFRVLLDQLKGQTFLEAFQSLKGGGAITQVEGQKAEQAIARLNTAQSDAEFGQALQDLAEVAASAKKKAIEMAGSEQSPQQPTVQPGTVEDGWQFKGGNPADQANWVRI